jgi:glycerol-3-phosphate dehydrogenase subunit B
VSLPLLDAPIHRDAYSTDLARLFDDASWRGEIARAWKPRTLGVARLGVPAVIGLDHAADALADLEKRIGVRLFEIPTLPPSVPGLRLERALRRAAVEAGVWLIEGSHAIGRVDGRSGGRRVAGVVVQTAGGPRAIDAGAVLLGTGGMLHGGLVARQDGRVQESVFDLPVVSEKDRTAWAGPSPLTSQPYASFGLAVARDMRPTGPDGVPIFKNLFAAGGVLAGADRTAEGSRQGIDLATAYRAVEAALA